MSDSLDLKDIEKRAFRAEHQDGLYDIYFGGVVLCMTILAVSTGGETYQFSRFVLYMIGLVVLSLLFQGGRKYITTPRLGRVKFGPRRQRRKMILFLVMAGIILVQVAIVVGTSLLLRNPQWAISLGLSQINPDFERLIVAAISALFVGPSMVMISYFMDFLRGYYIAFIASLAVFSLVWFHEPVYLVIAGMLILIPGIVVFIRFLIQHPLPPAEGQL
ncbi:MAG: hypothetical protein M1281_13600 [Chloroflexi bacterium]|nr:hypothetical protein [Chloroflexota bacterium]